MEKRHYLDCMIAVNESHCLIYRQPELEEDFRKEMAGLPIVNEGEEYLEIYHMEAETEQKCLDVCGPCANFKGCQ